VDRHHRRAEQVRARQPHLHRLSRADGLPNDFVYGILEDGRGGLWVSTNKGLARFDPQTLAFKTYDRADGLQGSEFNQWAFFKNAEGVMFFGGINGLNAFHPDLIQDNPFLPAGGDHRLRHLRPAGQPARMAAAAAGGDEPGEIELPYTDDFFEFAYAALHFSSPE
jgi:hypothetical protein